MFNRRVTRTEASRTVTCLEVSEQGLLPNLKLCSGCDYYRNNIALNAMAQKKPRPLLSQYWQCTTPHKYGEVVSARDLSTPYQPVKLTKYNSLQVVTRGSGDVVPSPGNKRVRLFSPRDGDTNDRSNVTVQAMGGMDINAVLTGRNIAMIERDVARAEQNKLCRERDRLSDQLAAAVSDLARVKLELANAVLQRDRYQTERDVAREERAAALHDVTVILDQRDQAVADLELRHRIASQNMLAEVQEKNSNLFNSLKEKQTQLVQRVAYLEAMNSGASFLRVSQNPNKDKMRLIERFATLLSPELLSKEEQLNEIFEVMFSRRKKFKKFVKAKLCDDIRDSVRLSTCREIKQLFAPWRVLQVMDCSQQSLNQVSIILISKCVTIYFH
jgi:hypothetical protein